MFGVRVNQYDLTQKYFANVLFRQYVMIGIIKMVMGMMMMMM